MSQSKSEVGTRSVTASSLRDSIWLPGPPFLHHQILPSSEMLNLVEPDTNTELHSEVKTLVIHVVYKAL